jgi:2-keto-4-pentenoate hydratase/2-oxohepta-3-ene-1,7-dioic acid hydratase in catechol pathway
LQCGATDLMITPVPKLIAYISTMLPLLPGDLIVSGTAGGVGAKGNPPLWLKPGDVAEVEIGCISILRNRVETEA